MSHTISDITVQNASKFDGTIVTAGIIAPTIISANQNNYTPTGLDTATVLRLSSSASVNITGILAPTVTANGRILTITNTNSLVGGFNIILTNEDTGSTAANRFALDGQNQVLLPGQSSTIRYDTTTVRWRSIGSSSMGNMGGTMITAGIITPTSLSIDQNNFNPTGLVNATVLRLSSSATVNITGLTASTNGRLLTLLNTNAINTFNIILTNEDTGSTAANRFSLDNQNAVILPGQSITIRYDTSLTRWCTVSSSPMGAFGGAIVNSGIISPASLSANQNDYAPTGLVNSSVIRLTSSQNVNITGLLASTNGRLISVYNVGTTFNIVFTSEDAGSVAANRFTFDGQNVVLLPGQSITLKYGTVMSRWRSIGSSAMGRFGGAIVTAGTIVPASLSVDQNNYNPTGLDDASVIRLSSSATVNITGLVAPSANGRLLSISNSNTTTFNIILTHEGVGSTAANRFLLDTQNQVLLPGQTATLRYDTSVSRWRAVSSSPTGNLGGTFITAGVITPTTLSSDQDNYNPTGLINAAVIRLSATSLVNISGLAGGTNGRQIVLMNVSTSNIRLLTLSVLSSAGNRFALSGDITLVNGSIITLIYDGVSNVWRSTGAGGGGSSGGLLQSKWIEVSQDISTTTPTWPTPNTTLKQSNDPPQTPMGSLPTASITVLSVTGFPTTGTLYISTANNGVQIVTYTGLNIITPTFTGCSGGSGNLTVGGFIWAGPTTTTITSGSNGQVLPQATINVTSTTGYPSSGEILVETDVGKQLVTYTGITGTTFTGCSGGTLGVMSTGNDVVNVTPTLQDILTIVMTTNGGSLIITSTASCTTKNNVTAYFQVVIDGVVRRGGSTQGNGAAPAGASVIGLKIPFVPQGTHVITVRWRVQAVSTPFSNIWPVTNGDDNNASLLVQEVTD